MRLVVSGGIFLQPLAALFLGFDLLYQSGTGFIVELIALRIELLLQALQFLAHVFQLGAPGIELGVQHADIALAFVGQNDGSLNVDHADLGRPGDRVGSGGGSGLRCRRGRGLGSGLAVGQR